MKHPAKIAVIGGNSASLAAAIAIASGGHNVEIFSPIPVERYARRGNEGITLPLGDESSHETLNMLDAIGVPFDRNEEGGLNLEVLEDSSDSLVAKAGERTYHHVHRVLSDQVRMWKSRGQVTLHNYREVIDFMLLDNRLVGLISLNAANLKVKAQAFDAVIVALKNPGSLFTEQSFAMSDFAPFVNLFRKGTTWRNPHHIETTPGGFHVDAENRIGIDGIFVVGDAVCKDNGDTRFSFINDLTKCFSFNHYLDDYLATTVTPDRDILAKCADEEIAGNITILDSIWNAKLPPMPVVGEVISVRGMVEKVFKTTLEINRNQTSRLSWDGIWSAFENTRLTDDSKWANREKVELYKLSLLKVIADTVIESSVMAADEPERKGNIIAVWSNGELDIKWE